MRKQRPFNDEYYRRLEYIKHLYNYESDEQKTIKKQSKYEGFDITINEQEGQLLYILTKISGAKKVLEIGTLFGYSTLWFAKAIGQDGKITTIEADKYECDVARENFKDFKNIEVICGSALKVLEKMDDVYDLIFIDADKINYINYLKFADGLLKKGGLLIADNSMLGGEVCKAYRTEARQNTQDNMKAFNKALADKEKWESIMINTEEGFSIAIKK
ncbi:MAG: O-methyltransferase [Rickettsiales bacterium]|nr:MAG: O-methyltransferase [Rickettsiales bacterium]